MENRVGQNAWKKYEEAKSAGDLEAMFKLVDNGKQLYCARSKCNGVANFIKRRIPKIKHLNVKNDFNWFSIQQINRAEAGYGDEEHCCVQIALQPKSSSRKAKVNPIQKLFTELGLCKHGGQTQPILCSYTNGKCIGHACLSFADRPPSDVFDKGGLGGQTLLSTANQYSLLKLQHNV